MGWADYIWFAFICAHSVKWMCVVLQKKKKEKRYVLYIGHDVVQVYWICPLKWKWVTASSSSSSSSSTWVFRLIDFIMEMGFLHVDWIYWFLRTWVKLVFSYVHWLHKAKCICCLDIIFSVWMGFCIWRTFAGSFYLNFTSLQYFP